MRIERITVEIKADDTPDTSYLGEYRDSPAIGAPAGAALTPRDRLLADSPSGKAIDRKARGDMLPHEARYFHPAEWLDGEDAEQAYERMEALNHGDWQYIGLRAVAIVDVGETLQTIETAGLWGIESDSGSDYLVEVASDELHQLRDILADMGINPSDEDWQAMTESAIDHATA